MNEEWFEEYYDLAIQPSLDNIEEGIALLASGGCLNAVLCAIPLTIVTLWLISRAIDRRDP